MTHSLLHKRMLQSKTYDLIGDPGSKVKKPWEDAVLHEDMCKHAVLNIRARVKSGIRLDETCLHGNTEPCFQEGSAPGATAAPIMPRRRFHETRLPARYSTAGL